MNTNESTLRVPSVVVTTSVVFVNNQSGCLRHLSADRRSTPDCLRHDDLVPRNVVSRQPQTAPPPRHPSPQLRWLRHDPPFDHWHRVFHRRWSTPVDLSSGSPRRRDANHYAQLSIKLSTVFFQLGLLPFRVSRSV